MRVLLIAALSSSALFAQTLVDPSRIAQLVKTIGPQADEQKLHCEVTPIRPMLNFGFQFQAGYRVRVPMSQYLGPGHGWGVLARVTPEGKPTVYLGSRIRLPPVPQTKTELEIGGGYLIGPGKYSVSLAMYDDEGRVCRKDWTVDAKLTHAENKVKLTIPPDTVADMSGRGLPAKGVSAMDAGGDAPPFRLTVFLHAAPLMPRRTRMRANDRVMLIGSLASLLQHVPTKSVRLVVFNLDQQKELYRKDDFKLESLDRVAQSINQLEIGLVDVAVLANRKGHVDLLADLVNREVNSDSPSDAVVFLGPPARFTDSLPQSAAAGRQGSSVPKFFFFAIRGLFRGPVTVATDSIASTVSRWKGKKFEIYTPGEFAGAIEQLERAVSAVRER